MTSNQNHSAGSARHTSRPPARLVSSSKTEDIRDIHMELLDDLRNEGADPYTQYQVVKKIDERGR
jgi:hypothetical protein